MPRNTLVVLIILFTQSIKVIAQQPFAINYTVLQGLPSNSVYQIFQDKDKYIWIANEDGLCRYDGNSFVTYVASNMSSTAGSNVQQDITGRIWFQNFDGFCFYTQNDSLKQLDNQKPSGYLHYGLLGNYIYTLHESGVWVYDIYSLKLVKEIPLTYTNLVYSLAAKGYYYIVDHKDLIVIDQNFNIQRIKHVIPDDINVVILYEANDTIYVIPKYNQHKCIYALTHDYKLKPIFYTNAGYIHGMTIINNKAWLFSPNGIHIVAKEGEKVIYPHSSVSGVIVDHQKNLWISTTNEGLKLVPDINNKFINLDGYIPMRIIDNGNNYIVFTTKDEALSVSYDWQVIKKIYEHKNLAGIYYAHYDSTTDLSFTTSKQFKIFSTNSFKLLETYDYAIKQIQYLDKKYFICVTSGMVALYRWGGQHIQSAWDNIGQPKANDKFHAVINLVRAKSLAIDYQNQKIFVSTNKGLYLITPQGYLPYHIKDKPFYATKLFYVNNALLALTSEGKLWDISQNNNPIHINNETTSLPKIIKLAVQNNDQLCIAGDEQICVFKITQSPFRVISLPIKLKATDINDLLVSKGNVIVLTYNGVIVLPIKNATPTRAVDYFTINSLMVNNRLYSLQKQLPEFNYSENNIRISIAILDYNSPKKHQIEYSITEGQWNTLPPGVYTIELASLSPSAYNIKFKVNGEEAKPTIAFVINKPFWLKWWFISFVALVILSAVIIYYRWQVKLIMNKNKLLTERYELQNELNKSVLTSIRSQMNPHFFYNALNTIQSYIFNNDKKNASNYLSKFSKLTRNILEMSDKELIKLADEISNLQLYLDLEKMRFEDEFQFEITVANNIDLEMIKIPPMLIQPYVENAVKHGLLHLRGDKKLTVNFKIEQPGVLRVVIDDNGIGRKRSEELNKIRNDKHQSFSTQANARRLEILNKGKPAVVGIEIIDKYNDAQMPLGTQVILDIPYN